MMSGFDQDLNIRRVSARGNPHPVHAMPQPPHLTRLGALERLPTWLICVPLALQWLWLGVRFRGLTLPSVANPSLTAGGLVGEEKMEYFRGMGPLAQSYTARTHALLVGPLGQEEVGAELESAGLSFPLVVKPDLGLCGYGVRKVEGPAALMAYLCEFPRGERVVLQTYLAAEYEAGIFYARFPGQASGHVIGMAFRSYPRVVGDGVRCVERLIAEDPRARRVHSAAHHMDMDLTRVPVAGEVVRLATIASTRVGGFYSDGTTHVTPALTAAIDMIARDMPNFYVGRFDVRFASLAELRAGTGFLLMEVNGAGSEAIHAWDPQYGLWAAFRIIFRKQRLMFAIGALNRDSGHPPIGLWALFRLHCRQRWLIERYPPSM